jgi:predicted DNA-binding transcriptional regulator AlpA
MGRTFNRGAPMNIQEHSTATPDRILRGPEVLSLTGLTPSARDRLVRAKQFPQPFPLIPGGRAVGWSWLAVQAWITERIAAGADRGAA